MLTIMSNWEPPQKDDKGNGKGKDRPAKYKLTEKERQQLNQGLLEFLILAVILALVLAA